MSAAEHTLNTLADSDMEGRSGAAALRTTAAAAVSRSPSMFRSGVHLWANILQNTGLLWPRSLLRRSVRSETANVPHCVRNVFAVFPHYFRSISAVLPP